MKNYDTLYNQMKSTAKVGIATGLVALLSGCVTMTGENGVLTIASSPVRPNQWKNHPVRTSSVTAAYLLAIGAAVGSGGNGGSKDDSKPAQQTYNTGNNNSGYTAPVAHEQPSAPSAPVAPPSGGPIDGGG